MLHLSFSSFVAPKGQRPERTRPASDRRTNPRARRRRSHGHASNHMCKPARHGRSPPCALNTSKSLELTPRAHASRCSASRSCAHAVNSRRVLSPIHTPRTPHTRANRPTCVPPPPPPSTYSSFFTSPKSLLSYLAAFLSKILMLSAPPAAWAPKRVLTA